MIYPQLMTIVDTLALKLDHRASNFLQKEKGKRSFLEKSPQLTFCWNNHPLNIVKPILRYERVDEVWGQVVVDF
jgi:hypothetical protein